MKKVLLTLVGLSLICVGCHRERNEGRTEDETQVQDESTIEERPSGQRDQRDRRNTNPSSSSNY